MKLTRYLLWVVFLFFSSTFVLCALLDYAIATWWLVQMPHATPAMFWYNSASWPVVQFVGWVGLGKVLVSYGIISFGMVSFGAFAASVLILFALKLYQGVLKAFATSFLLYGGLSLMLFEFGLEILDPGEFFVHVTNFTWGIAPWLTNEVVLYLAYAAFSLGFVMYLIFRFKKPAVAPRGANA
jgi:hypothetical protein